MNDAVVNFLSTISTMVQDEKAEGEGGLKRGGVILKSGGGEVLSLRLSKGVD